MKRDRIRIEGTAKNRIRIVGQTFQDAIIKARYTTFRGCKFFNCKKRYDKFCEELFSYAADEGVSAKNVSIP